MKLEIFLELHAFKFECRRNFFCGLYLQKCGCISLMVIYLSPSSVGSRLICISRLVARVIVLDGQ
jgi:hypothetical protein